MRLNFAAASRKALMLQMINFPQLKVQLLESLLRWVFGTFPPWTPWDGQWATMSWERCVSRILPNIGPPPLLKSNSRSPTFRKTGKEIQLNFSPIEESGPRENGWGGVEPHQLFQIPPFAAVFRTRLARRPVADELKLLIPLARTQTKTLKLIVKIGILAGIWTTIPKWRKCSSCLSFGPLSSPPHSPFCRFDLKRNQPPRSQFYPLLNVGSSNLTLFRPLSWILVLNFSFRSILPPSPSQFEQTMFHTISILLHILLCSKLWS